ncbi:MAG: hypothetical protein WEE64_11315 [Dehalococcoidia bacterium]
MLSSALAGLLKVGAVALTAGGLATGIYLAVQVGQEEDADRAQTGDTPAATSTALSPPNQVVRPTAKPTITPTYVLAPSPTPPTGIDTSDWKTYTSPDGYSFKYPPDWTLEEEPPLSVISPEVVRSAGQPGEGSTPGMADVEVSFERSDGFPVNAIIENCERPDPLSLPTDRPDTAGIVTLLGHRAVECRQSGINPTSRAQWLGLSYIIDFSPDTVIKLTGYVVPKGNVNLATVEAIIRSFALGGAQ